MLLNQERANELMKEFQIDALLATTRQNVLYLSDFIGWAQHTYGNAITETFAVYCADQSRPPGLIISRQDETYLANQGTWIEDVRGYGGKGALAMAPGAAAQTDEERLFLAIATEDARRSPSARAALVRLLKDRGLESARIALDQEGISPKTRAAMEKELPKATFLEAGGLFRLIRLVKTPDEIARMRRASRLDEDGVEAFHKAIAEGVTEKEVASHFYRTVAGGGARWDWFHLASGPMRASAIFPPSERRFQKGDSWKYDAGIRLDGYYADHGGCGVVGEPSPELERQWKAVEKGVAAGFEVMRGGVKGSEIFQAALRGLKEGGLDYNGVFVGHTIGAEPREFPYTLGMPVPVNDPFLPESTDMPLPAGAVISYEVPTGVFGTGGCQAEYTVILNETGFEHLIPLERTLYRN